MSQAYKDVLEFFIKMQEIMIAEDKEYRKNPKKTARIAALLVIASLYSNLSLNDQYVIYKTMIRAMSETLENYKAIADSAEEIAATLIFASELKKVLKK